MENDLVYVTFYGDHTSVDELVRKIDPEANTFDCNCGNWLPLEKQDPKQRSKHGTHKIGCYWCHSPMTIEIAFKKIDGQLRKYGSLRKVSDKLKAIENIL